MEKQFACSCSEKRRKAGHSDGVLPGALPVTPTGAAFFRVRSVADLGDRDAPFQSLPQGCDINRAKLIAMLSDRGTPPGPRENSSAPAFRLGRI
jgi:hypothetical protein